jgi:hypothetical protein
MLGSLLFAGSLLLLVVVVVCDRFGRRPGHRWAHDLDALLHKSRKAHLGVYGSLMTAVWFSFYQFAAESSSSLLFFRSYLQQVSLGDWFMGWGLVIAGLLQVNVFRFPLFRSEDDHLTTRNLALEETVDKASSPTEGVEHAMNVLKAHRKEWDPITVESFLRYLIRRDDEVGAEARRRLKGIRKKQEPT